MIEIVTTSTPEVVVGPWDEVLIEQHNNIELIESALGPMGASGAPGAPGAPGPAGSAAGTSYTHIEPTPSATWLITHNLNRYPSITVVDSTGGIVEGSTSYVDANNVTIAFAGGFSGKAYLN